MHRNLSTVGGGALFACLLLAGCGGGDGLLLPGDGDPAAIAVLHGDGQQGRVREPLADPLVVQVTDSRGRPVEGARVVFELTSPSPEADIVPDTANTNADGEADARIVLGTRMGPQTGEARVVVAQGTQEPKTSFTATALSENANGIAAFSGDQQTGPAGSTLSQPLVIQVTDAFGNPISGVPIIWTVDGGGSVSETSNTTNGQGLASVQRTLGPAAGQQSTLASSEGLAGSPVTFTHTATAGSAAGLSIVSGNDQTAEAGTRLPADLVVRLLDAQGNGVPGTAVTWVVGMGGGSVTPENGITDEAGRASAQWTLGPNPGQNRVDAVVSGVGIVNFRATATGGAPAALSIETQPSSTATNGVPFSRQPVVQVRDARGNDVATAGVDITAQLSGGGGEVVGTTHRLTNANGQATFTDLAISGAEGPRTLVFTASGYAGATSSTIDVRPLGTTTTITTDAPDPSISGASVTVGFLVTSAGPTPIGTVSVTVSDEGANCSAALQGGAASCQLVLNRTGDRTLTATYSGAPGLTGSSDTESHRVEAPPPENRPPKADFSSQCADLTCQFTDRSSDPDGNPTIVSWSWNFGDPLSGANNTSPAQNPAHTFSGSGKYAVTLTVTDNRGATNTASAQVDVKAPPPPENKAPQADFDVSCTDLTCSFTDKSKDDDGSIASWHWDFGDGQSSTEQSPSHPYTAEATYHVTLTVTDNGGASDSKTHDAHPTEPPNQAPTAQDDGPYSTQEDTPLHGDGLLANDSDLENGPLTAERVTDAGNGHVEVHADGSFDYTPDPNFFGDDSFAYRVKDDHGNPSNTATVRITVQPVDDAPTFTLKNTDLSANVGEAKTELDWARDISPGPANEAGQALTFQVGTDRPDLFSVQPSIDANGALTFTTSSSEGDASVSVQLQDNGGTANGGVDTSSPETFTIHISGGGGG